MLVLRFIILGFSFTLHLIFSYAIRCSGLCRRHFKTAISSKMLAVHLGCTGPYVDRSDCYMTWAHTMTCAAFYNATCMYKQQEFIPMEMKIMSIILQGNPEKKKKKKMAKMLLTGIVSRSARCLRGRNQNSWEVIGDACCPDAEANNRNMRYRQET